MIFWMEHLFCRPKTQEELMKESIAQAVIKVLLGILSQLTLVTRLWWIVTKPDIAVARQKVGSEEGS